MDGTGNWADLDWAARWRDLVEVRRQRVEGLVPEAGIGFWDRRADQFRRLSEQYEPGADPLFALLTDALGSTGSLLDVGAGTGRYTLPLAARAGRVTAVEPSSAMRRHLAERVAAAGLTNVQIVPTTWEEAVVEPHDVVLAAHILYPIADIAPFVQRLVASARRAWFLTIRVEPMGAEFAPLWRDIWGSPYPLEPTLLDLYPLLFRLDLRANVRLKPFHGAGETATLEEAVAHARSRLFLPEGMSEHDERIRTFLREHMRQEGDRWRWPGQPQEAIISGPAG
jgi:SAM-dependent methyltransferase